jgi:transcriptional regulator with XRE-family HTH domain
MRKIKATVRSATEVDTAIGNRIRRERRAANLTQTELADILGVTFQQIQKYEKGRNRVAASRLVQIADALNVPVLTFFE